MMNRPLAITIIGWLFIIVGGLGIAHQIAGIIAGQPFDSDLGWVCLVGLVALIGGAFLLRGRGWARWLLAAWMLFHLVISALHSVVQLVVHALLFAVIGYFLFQRRASAFLRSRKDLVKT